jgi:hypothetical protein
MLIFGTVIRTANMDYYCWFGLYSFGFLDGYRPFTLLSSLPNGTERCWVFYHPTIVSPPLLVVSSGGPSIQWHGMWRRVRLGAWRSTCSAQLCRTPDPWGIKGGTVVGEKHEQGSCLMCLHEGGCRRWRCRRRRWRPPWSFELVGIGPSLVAGPCGLNVEGTNWNRVFIQRWWVSRNLTLPHT